MNRKLAREEAYKFIFGYSFTQETDSDGFNELKGDTNLDDADREYIMRTYTNAVKNYAEINELIKKYAKGFALERIFKADLAAMILAIAEMKYDNSIPLKVSITEAIDIVKKYSMSKSNSFVNGILASVYKELIGEVQ